MSLIKGAAYVFAECPVYSPSPDRYRQVPPFGPATIRRFSANTSEMSHMAARNFEDLLQVCLGMIPIDPCVLTFYKCSIPVFEGLLPEPHNKIVIDLLFILAHWHGLAKLRMHSDLTLDILDQQTTELGEHLRHFKAKVCTAYATHELDREANARSRRQAKEAAKCTEKGRAKGSGAAVPGPMAGASLKGKQKATPEQSQDAPLPRQPKKKKSFNLRTYKLHALGDYVASIRRFGTTDSYSTEPVSINPLTARFPTQLPSGGIGTSYTEGQVPSNRSKDLHSPADAD